MKLKGLLIFTCIIFIVFLIYLTTLDKDVYYLSLGDFIASGSQQSATDDDLTTVLKNKNQLEKSITKFIDSDARTTDYIKMIQENGSVEIDGKKQTIKNALIKADIVTISLGNNDLFYGMGLKNEYDHSNMREREERLDEIMDDMDQLFELVREYCKEDILVTSFYAPKKMNDFEKEMVLAANQRLKRLSKKYKITYLDIDTTLQKEQNLSSDLLVPTTEGYQKINELIGKKALQLVFER